MVSSKIFAAASREYRSTALTRAFFFSVIVFPAVILGAIFVIASLNLLDSDKPPLSGEIAVADSTEGSVVLEGLRVRFDPAVQEAAAEAMREQFRATARDWAARLGVEDTELIDQRVEQALRRAGIGQTAEVDLVELPADADLEAQKSRVLSGELTALVVADEATVGPRGEFGLYHDKGLDDDYIGQIRGAVQSTVVAERFDRADIDPRAVELLRQPPQARTVTVTEEGEKETNTGIQFIVPAVFFFLLWMSVMSGGQYLLMSTIEEKSSRVMEVILSAISPMQLLIGKILGQGLVGLTILGVYVGVGLVAADQVNVLDQIPKDKLPWLAVYFVMAYFFFAGLMAAVGSAVTEIREAQTLMGPIMMLLMIPIFLWFFILDNPNSMFAQVCSFIPPITPFVMILRVSQFGQEIPGWQIAATTVVGFAGVVAVVWAAAKIFRVGVLMYGKPPSFLTLLKWIRYA